MPGVDGFMYPNEVELQWSLLIVLYPYITGLVAGAFILASLERVFKVEAVRPTYRLALLTALAFLLVAPLPLQLHLGHPERSFEMYLTPHRSSAMAMFGFVYLWYLTVVLLVEIWLEYRADIVRIRPNPPGVQALDLQGPDAGLGERQPGGPPHRRQGRLHRHRHRHPLGLSAAWLRGLHLRIGEGQPVVVHAAHAHRVPLFRHGFRHCGGAGCLHGLDEAAEDAHRHALRRHRRQLSLLHVRHRFLAGDAGPGAPHLRSRRIVPQPGFHGAHAPVDFAGSDADLPGDAGAHRRCWQPRSFGSSPKR